MKKKQKLILKKIISAEKTGFDIGQIEPREIVEEMKDSYIDYAMSVIVSRALPDIRDGLKPVQRKILFVMKEEGLTAGAKFRKSATVVGTTLGRYHPHSDVAIYDAMVRMAQDFSLRYPLIQGQGNFGCFTKETKIKLVDGRSLNFKELMNEAKKGKRLWTFTFNHETGKIEVAEIKNPRLTRKNRKIIEVALDNGEKIKCTLNHKFLLRSGEYKEASTLMAGDSLMPAYFNINRIRSHYNYLGVLQPFSGGYEFVHRLADEYNVRMNRAEVTGEKYVLHHKDFDKFNNSPDNIERVSAEKHYQIHLQQAKNLWKEKGDSFREKHRQSLVRVLADPIIKKKMSEGAKKLWLDPDYRLHYPRSHFVMAAKKLWENPEIRELHREKARRQWRNPQFRERVIMAISKRSRQRLKEDPDLMKKLAQMASLSLKKNWKNPAYREMVVRSKILGYVRSLLGKYRDVTPEIYERERTNNGVPKIDNALSYFNDFPEIVVRSREYNHRVVQTRILETKEDVYDLTVSPWHNFLLDAGIFVHNSIDDPGECAAMRYTESRLSKIGEEMLRDIDKDTVNFIDNYDGTRKEPAVLPSPLPQLLLNGSLGIAVGMATNMPPHNLSEVCDALAYLIDHPKADTADLFQFIKGPDFPTGGQIFNLKEIIAAYSQGKGPVLMRGRAEIAEQEKSGRSQIIISEIPFQVQKSTLIERLAGLVSEKKVEGIRDIRDESDKEGLRIVIDLQKEAYPQKILNYLYKFTDLQKTFHINLLALVDGLQPKVLSLAELLSYFLLHRREVIFRRTRYDLEKAKERAHILEGLHRCLANIDEVIRIIRNSASRPEAEKNLMKRFKLSQIQANAILETKLAALAKLERKRIEEELKALQLRIKELAAILNSPERIRTVVKKELAEIKERFGDERRTEVVVREIEEIAEADLIPQEETIITLTRGGYIKRINPSVYKLQKRGGKGILGMKTMQEDIVDHFVSAMTHDDLFFFTDSGKVFRIQAFEIPEGTRVARGRGLLNFLEISPQDKVLSLIASSQKDQEKYRYLVMATRDGIIKKTAIAAFGNVRKSGLIAMTLKKGDTLRKVAKSTGEDEIIIVTKKAQAIRFKEKDLREMGRQAAGIRGIRLKKGDEVVGMTVIQAKGERRKAQSSGAKIVDEKQYLLIITENGYGKRSEVNDYRMQRRGGSGIKAGKITPKTGEVIAAKVLSDEEDLIVISQRGQVIRTVIASVPKLSRATQGVHVMKLEPGDKVASAACI